MKEKIKELLLSRNKDDFTLGVEILDSLGEDLTPEDWADILYSKYPNMGNNIFVKGKTIGYTKERGWFANIDAYNKKYGIE